jgi:histidine kinase/DNA gyrase B/HSP90-like ATPase/restriction-modification system family protein
MPTKRDVVEQLKREELQDLATFYDLEVEDRRVRDDLVNVLTRAKRARLADMLASLSRDRLKEICVALSLDDGGREKSAIIDRLCGEEELREDDGGKDERRSDGSSVARGLVPGEQRSMPTKRDVIDQFKREELQDLTTVYGLEVEDRRVREDLVDVLVRAKRARLADMLGAFSRDRLKEICVALELDDGGREKSLIVDRLCGEEAVQGNDDEDDDQAADAGAILARLVGLPVVPRRPSWPTKATYVWGARELPLDIYVRLIGGSSRGNPLERRFQNPSQRSPITIDQRRHSLLLGLWLEQGEERAVIVAFDAYRRAGRATRFSMFMPLALLERAADTGFATHENNKGETIYAFRPENFDKRYLYAYFEEIRQDDAQPAHPPPVRAPRPEEVGVESSSLYIRPRVGMYSAFARLNYKPWFALAEFVDNSVQSFLTHRAQLVAAGHDGPLVLDVNIDDNEITVTDRAGGIAWKDFPRAFSPAAPPDDPSGLSEFGLGMKAAACWFSKRWTVQTSALGEVTHRTVTFDVPKISREGIETLPIETTSARESDHFTVVTLKDLRVRPRGATVRKIKEHLASIYRVLMKEGIVRLRFTMQGNTEELRYEPPEILEAPYHRTVNGPTLRWHKEISVEVEDKTVTGWVAVMKVGSHVRAGFSVFRRRRLVDGSIGETYKPHTIFGSPNSFASQRIVGELFVDGFDVTHTKDGIQWGPHEEEVLSQIYRQISTPRLNLVDQAEGYRARKTAASLPPDFGADAIEATATALSQPAATQVLRAELSPARPAEPVAGAPAAPPLQTRTLMLEVTRDAKPWRIELALVRDAAMPFYSTRVETCDGHEIIKVELNLEHELSVVHLNDNESALDPVLRIVAALALGEKVARDGGVANPGAVRRNANDVLTAIARAGVVKART